MQIRQLTEELNSARKTIAEKENEKEKHISELLINFKEISSQNKVRSFDENEI